MRAKDATKKEKKMGLRLDSCVMSQKAAQRKEEKERERERETEREREPPPGARQRKGDPRGAFALPAQALTSMQPFKMPYHSRTSLERDLNAETRGRRSRTCPSDGRTEQHLVSIPRLGGKRD